MGPQSNFMTLVFSIFLICVTAIGAPQKLILKNQFGEQSNNWVQGSVIPLPGSGNVIIMNGATAPVDGTTGDDIAGKGSLYIAQDTGAAYLQTGLISNPVWSAVTAANAAAIIATALTGYTSGAGAITSADSILSAIQKLNGNTAVVVNGQFTPQSEAKSSAGALSTTKMLSTITNASTTYAVTLAAPSSQDGQLKVIKAITAMTGTVTLAMTNISVPGYVTPTGSTTLTFTNVGDSAVFMAVGAKWVLIGGSAVAS